MAYTIQEVCELAHNETERKVDPSKLSIEKEFGIALVEFLSSGRYKWAQKKAAFNTQANVATYDLTDTNILTDADDFSEVVQMFNTQDFQQQSNTDCSWDGEITPLLETFEQARALVATTAAAPSRYMMEPGSWGTIRFQAPCNGAYPILVIYQAVPNVPFPDELEEIPLVPGPLHYGLVTALKRRLFDYLYGQEDPRYVTANMQYEQFKKDAQRRGHWAQQAMRVWGSGDAVRST